MQLARRSLGLSYTSAPYNQFFHDFCDILLSYQYTKLETEVSETLISWLYDHSDGIISILVSLIHDAQEIAILSDTEALNHYTLEKAYKKRLSMLHGFIQPASIPQKTTRSRRSEKYSNTINSQKSNITI